MAADESRFGRISDTRRCWAPYPIRPIAPRQVIQEFTYVYAAVSPQLAIVLKELKESSGWIRFIQKAELLSAKKMVDLEDESTQLCNIIAKSIVTTKENHGID